MITLIIIISISSSIIINNNNNNIILIRIRIIGFSFWFSLCLRYVYKLIGRVRLALF